MVPAADALPTALAQFFLHTIDLGPEYTPKPFSVPPDDSSSLDAPPCDTPSTKAWLSAFLTPSSMLAMMTLPPNLPASPPLKS